MHNIGQSIDHTAVHIACSDHIGRITIANEQRRNALNQAGWRAISKAVDTLIEQGARVIVLVGQGAHFCAGADISEFDTVRADAASARIYEDDNVVAFQALANATVPTIAEIRGCCFGGGLGLAAACDLRLAAEDATFAVPAAKLGLAYPAEAMDMLANAVGLQMLRKMLFAATVEDAATMKASGFLLTTTGSEKLASEITQLATKIAQGAPLSHAANKLSLFANTAEQLSKAQAAGDATFESADYAEGRAAFAARRKAEFRGN